MGPGHRARDPAQVIAQARGSRLHSWSVRLSGPLRDPSGLDPRPAPRCCNGLVKLYADTTVRRHRQLAADVAFVVWVVLWTWLATRLYSLVLLVAAPGEVIESAGVTLSENMVGAGEAIDGLPVVGESVRGPFDQMAAAGAQIADAGRGQQEAVTRLAWFSAVALAVIPIATLAAVWLPLRVRFVRRASAAQRFVDHADDLDLFALRALARQPLPALAKIHDDPAGQWRAGNPQVITALARLELADEGLHYVDTQPTELRRPPDR